MEDKTRMAIIEDLLVAQTLVLIVAIEEEDLQAMEGNLAQKNVVYQICFKLNHTAATIRK